ncbi:sensor histidine kinase [Saccharothrix longispora]|uniref:histidine kinase n=1 Tax=Saccharothrix longispora TaxID=33920 RepID=A0ABU1PWC6_9PSEU|nr:histidine kinase [Saccharothrix longispora]MDR6594934.1 signal transduction histidine kinase [Saccharothrix longispora]
MKSHVLRLLPTAYPYALDTAVAVLFVVAYLGFAEMSTTPLWLGYPLAVLVGAPLAVRRGRPLLTLGVVLVAQTAATVAHITLEPFGATAFAAYAVASLCAHRVAVRALVASLVVIAAAIAVAEPWPDDIGLVLFASLCVGTAWALGRVTRVRRDYEARRAAQAASAAVTEERMRIARELHDVVAHGLSLIAVQAGTAAHVRDASVSEEALRVIETTSRGTLVEMRRLLGVLRSEDAAAELAPMPSMADLPELVSRAALAGVGVDLSVTGAVPEALGLTVYRIVQESVTNVVKHAAPATCTAAVEVSGSSVSVTVVDDGPGERLSTGRTGGHGLIGMRERVAVYGGTFSAGPRAAGGFAVRAEVPLP